MNPAVGSRHGPAAALATLCLVLFLTFLDTTIVSVVLAGVQSGLHAGVSSLQWVVNGYALPFAALMLVAGALGDRFGRRRLLLAGVVVFCLGSVLAALAPSVNLLVTARVVMGVGAAASEPGTLSLLRQVFPDSRARAWALGVWSAVAGLALALGPVIGGVLLGVAGWRSIFWFNLALGAVALGGVLVTVPESFSGQSRRIDLPGFALSALTLAAATYATIDGEQVGYRSGVVVALYVAAALAAVGFGWAETRASNPLLPLHYLRRPGFSVPLVVVFALYFGIFALFFFVALYLQFVAGESGPAVAARFAGMAVAMVGASLLTGRWVGRSGARTPLVTGTLGAGIAVVLVDVTLRVAPGAAPRGWALALALTLAGAGFGTALVPVTGAVLAVVPAELSGVGASATNTSREIGSVAGVAVLGALVNAALTSGLAHRLAGLGVPASFQGLVIGAVERGGIPANAASQIAAFGPLVTRVIDAAYAAFAAGLHVALLTAAGLILAAGVLAAAGLGADARVGRGEQLTSSPARPARVSDVG